MTAVFAKAALLLAALAAGLNTTLPTRAAAADASELVMATVSLTSEDFQLAMAWSTVLAETHTPLRITPVATGTVKGLRNLVQKRADMTLIGAPHYLDAVKREGSFKDDPPALVEAYKTLRVLFAVDTGMGQYVARADGPIRSFADIKGRKVGIGRPGGNAGRVSIALFKVHGLDADKGDVRPEYLDYGAALDQLSNGQLDVATVWGGVPQPGLDQASRSNALRLISPAPDSLPALQAALTNGQHYVYRTIPAERIRAAYEGRVLTDGPVRMWTFPFMVMVRADMPEEQAYALCARFWDHVDEVRGSSAALALIDVANAAQGLSADLHPGSRRCLAERKAL